MDILALLQASRDEDAPLKMNDIIHQLHAIGMTGFSRLAQGR
jgi:hypothetical protein